MNLRLTVFACFLLTALPAFCVEPVQSQHIELDALGDLPLKFQALEPVSRYAGDDLPGEVTSKPGEAFQHLVPSLIQHIEFLVDNGELVQQGQPYAIVRGPQVHHLLSDYDAKRALFALAERRYRNNQALYRKKSINESRWLEISQQYFDAKMQQDHLTHFLKWVIKDDGQSLHDDDALTLLAPVTGYIRVTDISPIQEDQAIAAFVAPKHLMLKFSVPAAMASGLKSVRFEQCVWPVNRVSKRVNGFQVNAWAAIHTTPVATNPATITATISTGNSTANSTANSKTTATTTPATNTTADVPGNPVCQLLPGQQLRVTPYYQIRGYRVDRRAIFEWQARDYLWVKQSQSLTSIPVNIVARDGERYIVQTPADLAELEVLVSAASAVQGVLMGLGGE